MVGNEFRKLFQRRSTMLLLAVLLFANGFLVWNLPLPGAEPYSGVEARHIRSLYGALPEEPGQALAALEQQYELLQSDAAGQLLTGDVYAELALFRSVIERTQAAADYGDMLLEIDENARTLLLTGRYGPESFEARNIRKSREIYQALWDVQPEVIYSGAVELLSGGRITDLILVLICLLLGLEMIVVERNNGTSQLLKSTQKGGIPLICAKIITSLIFLFFSTWSLYGTNLLIGLVRCGGFPLDAPIQSVYGFDRSPLKINIGAYLAGFGAVKFLWAAAVCAVVFAGCQIGNEILSCFFLSLPTLLLPGDAESWFMQYRGVNVLGQPLSSLMASLLFLLLICVMGSSSSVFLHIRRSPIQTDRGRVKGKQRRIQTDLFRHEARKLFLSNGGFLVLAVLLALQLVGFYRYDPWIAPQERLYMQYSQILAGQADAEKDAFLQSEEARFAELYARLEEYQLAVQKGEMAPEICETLSSGISRQLESESVFLRAMQQYQTMKDMGCDYVCQTGYERLLGPEGKRDALVLMMELLLALILALSPIHAGEKESSVELLLNCVPNRRKSERCKAILSGFFALAASCIVLIPHVLKIGLHYGLPGLGSAAASVPLLSMRAGRVWTGLMVYGACIAGTGLAEAGIICALSKKLGSTVQTALICAILILPLLFFYLFS